MAVLNPLKVVITNYPEAKANLEKAIQLRGDWDIHGKHGFEFTYEFVLAMCKIELDRNFQHEQSSDEDQKNDILADLKIAAANQKILSILQNDLKRETFVVRKWMEQNNITINDIVTQEKAE